MRVLPQMREGDIFSTDRPLLFSIAYRMLGSASDAEDVLQDPWLRYSAVDRATIRSPKALATTIVTRLCLDRLKSARATREEYIGPWLPEPVLTSEVDGPETRLQRSESVTLAFLVLLEQARAHRSAAQHGSLNKSERSTGLVPGSGGGIQDPAARWILGNREST